MSDGLTGAAMSTVDYVPARGTVSSWGDSYGNRVDRFLAAAAYLDGSRPSLIVSRGYYTRSVIAAWDFRDGTLTPRWTFDSRDPANGPSWEDQGNHAMAIGDVDQDGPLLHRRRHGDATATQRVRRLRAFSAFARSGH
jgi:hypothetical protein